MEPDKLQSRLDQQSTLICMLKQRNDKTLKELSDTTSRYEGSQQHLESLQLSLAEESRHRQLLEQRFRDLATNHEHMIRLKDEYKEQAQRLQQRVEGEEPQRVELEGELRRKESEWEERARDLEGRILVLEAERSEIERQKEEMKGEMATSARQHAELVQQLQASLKDGEAVTMSTREECAMLRTECTLKATRLTELQDKVTRLDKELQLSTSKLQLATEEVTRLQEELAKMRTRETERAERLERDNNILTLKKQLEESQCSLQTVQKEYAAYRAHSSELLAHERKLNQQLRHLLQ